MAFKKENISGIDINSRNIVYVRCSPEDKVISNICIQPLEQGGEDYWKSVQAGFDQFIRKFSVPGEDVVSCLPADYALIKKIAVDSDETDPKEIIEWELSQQMIGSVSEYIYDYQPLVAVTNTEKRHFLVVGYRNTAVTRLNKILKAKKLNPIVLDLDIFALVNVFELNYAERISSPALIIFSDGVKIKTVLTLQGEFVDCEILDLPPDAHTEDGFVRILSEVRNTIQVCNQQIVGNGPVPVFLTGALFSQSEFTAHVLQVCANSELLNPLNKISCTAGMDEAKLKEYGTYLAVSVGLAFRDLD